MVFSEGWMGNFNVKKCTNAVLVKCDVKPSQRSGIIYKTWVAIKPCGSVLCGHCTCMAGLSEVCNHVGAVLYKTMHEVSTASEISCTSLPNKWLPATVKKTVSPAQVRDIDFRLHKVDKCHSTISEPKRIKLSAKSQHPSLTEPSEAIKEEFFEKLSQLKYKPAVLSIHEKYNKPYIPLSQQKKLPKTICSYYMEDKQNSLYDELVDVSKSIMSSYEITDEEIHNLGKATQLQSKCRLWSIHRAGRITASNFKSAVRTNHNKPSVSLVKKLCYPQEHSFTSNATKWGCEHEANAVEEFFDWFSLEHEDPRLSSCGFMINKNYPFLGASPDGVIYCSCHGKYLLEVKCPYRCCNKGLWEAVNDPSFFLKDNEGVLSLDKSHSYYYQVQCQLGVGEVEKSFFVVWSPDTLHIEEIKIDLPFFEANMATANELIEKAVLPEIIGCWFTKPRVTTEVADSTPSSSSASSSKDTYCYCNGIDDGSKMICCDNDNCSSGQWFHYKCAGIKRAPRGKWFCRECSNNNK